MIRVTQVLDYFAEPGLIDWKVRVGAREAKKASIKAMGIGSNVDEWVKADVVGAKLPKLKTIEAKNCVDAYKRWKEDYKPELVVAVRLYDHKLGLTGEPDLYWGDLVIDIKCSREIQQKYWLQMAMYQYMKGGKRTAVLRLDKNLAEYEYVERDECWCEQQVFLGMLGAYKYFNPPMEEEREANGDKDSVTDRKSRSKKLLDLPENRNNRTGWNRQV